MYHFIFDCSLSTSTATTAPETSVIAVVFLIVVFASVFSVLENSNLGENSNLRFEF